tara:strand:- start:310 stop:528 length:219 start_codon:yes stop_codon:yes gene_type:complete
MTRVEFNNSRFTANTWVNYDGDVKYVAAISFDEALFALIDQKEDVPVDEWSWVRCENVSIALNRTNGGHNGG